MEAKDDVLGRSVGATEDHGRVKVGDAMSSIFPLGSARTCNQAKDTCRAAVVYTELHYKVESFDGQTIAVSGHLTSKMGRSQSINIGDRGLTMNQTTTILDGVEVIGERAEDKPFSAKLKIGQPLDLTGLVGTKVSLSFDQSML